VRIIYPSEKNPVWIDLWNPTRDEIDQACTDYRLNIPPREQLEEIEFSSRLQYEDGVFTLSVPVTPHHDGEDDVTSPLGFVLTKDILVTVRFARLHTFEAITERVKRHKRSAPDIFLVIVEALVDYGADRLEELRAETLEISKRIFHQDMQRVRRDITRTNRMLRATLVQVGDMGERLSYVRETLLVLQRAVPFVTEHGDAWMEPKIKARLKVAGSDVQSLNDFEIHLTDKIQFLLDAALGFINTEQNDLFKVLTIASVVGIPPTFFASMYGMNFHNMPEYSWTYGYEFGLGLILLSTIIPIIWFKVRGWW
jgi:magnesium transporter